MPSSMALCRHGEVRLSWEFPDDATIMISWHETGGPGLRSGIAERLWDGVLSNSQLRGLK